MDLKPDPHLLDDTGTESDFGPKIVSKNYYAFNSSVDSRLSVSKDPKRSSLKNSNLEGMKFGSSKSLKATREKKSVTFNLNPEIIYVKSYKLYNRTGSHKGSCFCKIF